MSDEEPSNDPAVEHALSWTERRELEAVAATAVRSVLPSIRDAFARPVSDDPTLRVEHKGEVDLVTHTDRDVERRLRAQLVGETGFAFLGEEGAGDEDDAGSSPPEAGRADGPIWVVDPIDGTTNFAHRIPHFAVSVALCVGDDPLVGVIADPTKEEIFSTDGDRALLGDEPLPTRSPPPLSRALVATGFPYDRRTSDDDNTALWRRFIKRAQGVRRFGAAALDLAWVAAGRLDGFWEPKLSPWDVAAGVALCRAVGCDVTEYDGGPWALRSPTILAAAQPLHAAMVDVIGGS